MSRELFEKQHSDIVTAVNTALNDYFPSTVSEQNRVYEAMRYSLLAGGKRVRPLLLIAFCQAFGGRLSDAMPFAVAIEMIHTSSLIHDDLPCMDNDNLRRGRATNHIVYGENTALMAGDAMMFWPFEIMAAAIPSLKDPMVGVEALKLMASSSGAAGMIGGQILDLENESKDITIDRLRRTCALKTGALFSASCVVGAILGGASAAGKRAAKIYAENIGLAFQVVDDLLDVTADEALLGKPIGSDREQHKNTFINQVGAENCRVLASQLTKTAIDALDVLPDPGFLKWIAESLENRIK